MRSRPISASAPGWPTTSDSTPGRACRSSSGRCWCTTRRSGRRRRGTCRHLLPELVGRDADLAALTSLLRTERLVEVVGPGGIGKTAVAIATGRAQAGSVWLARLESATTADDVLDTVIAALNATGGEAALLERLRAARTLLILDNCEHVRDAAAALAVRLLDAAPSCGSSPRARSRSTSTARRSTSSRRSGSATPSRSSRAAPCAPARTRPSCAGRSTASRWRSSWPPRAPARSRSRRSAAGSTIASASSATRRAASRRAGARCGRRSGGATSSCSPTTSVACGRSPRSPAARRSPPRSRSSRRSASPRRRRSTSSGGSPAARS